MFSGRAAPTRADEEVRRNVDVRAPEMLLDNQELGHGPCQGSVSSAVSRGMTSIPHLESLKVIPTRIQHEEFTAFVATR